VNQREARIETPRSGDTAPTLMSQASIRIGQRCTFSVT
jgi:hypothetical protein